VRKCETREQQSTSEREREKRAQRKNRNGCNEESIRQSGPVAKTPSTHEHVQTHVPGILFRGGDVRNVLSLREGEERKRWEEETLERDLNPRDRVLNTIDESANEDDKQREKRYFVILKQRRRVMMMMMMTRNTRRAFFFSKISINVVKESRRGSVYRKSYTRRNLLLLLLLLLPLR